MNPIKLSGGEVELLRTPTARVEPERGADPNASGPSRTTGALTPSDSIQVSSRATEIGELTAKVEQLPEIRADRVAELRALVQSGNYDPPAAEIAEAMLKDS
jgi:flagellar biosynthesis anti-sigma factor FlgM